MILKIPWESYQTVFRPNKDALDEIEDILEKKVSNSINLEKVHLRITQKSSMYHLMLTERNSVLGMKVTRNITCGGIIRQRIDYSL